MEDLTEFLPWLVQSVIDLYANIARLSSSKTAIQCFQLRHNVVEQESDLLQRARIGPAAHTLTMRRGQETSEVWIADEESTASTVGPGVQLGDHSSSLPFPMLAVAGDKSASLFDLDQTRSSLPYRMWTTWFSSTTCSLTPPREAPT